MVPLAFLLGLHNSDGRQCLELALVFYQGFVMIRVSICFMSATMPRPYFQ